MTNIEYYQLIKKIFIIAHSPFWNQEKEWQKMVCISFVYDFSNWNPFHFKHGRLKIRTSQEEAIRKRKEQEQKVLAYRVGMQKILHKKSISEFDNELMQLTAAILSRNPDISTLWNLRRQTIVELNDEAAFKKDLEFTESCLLVNPKSYCVWHHRCWVLENMPSPNWQCEVDVCTKYLKMDERNCKCSLYLSLNRMCEKNCSSFNFSSCLGLSALCGCQC